MQLEHRSPRLALSLVALGLLAASPAAAVRDVVGATTARFSWEPASGPVEGYLVAVVVNGGGVSSYGTVSAPTASIDASHFGAGYGDTIAVRVSAFNTQLGSVAHSDWSEEVRFVAPPLPVPSETPTEPTRKEVPPPPPTAPGRSEETPPEDPVPPASPVVSQRLDFDGDGRSDIPARLGEPEAFRILLMEGSEATGSRDMLALMEQRGWTLAGTDDYDGNGVCDLLWSKPSTGALFVVLLDADGVAGWQELTEAHTPGWFVAGSADLDGNGASDLLLRHAADGRVRVWLLQGADVVDVHDLAYVGIEWRLAGTGDYDGDGQPDLLWHDPQRSELRLWLLEGLRVAWVGQLEHWALGPNWKITGSADHDGDGADEIVIHDEINGRLALNDLAIETTPSGVSLTLPGVQLLAAYRLVIVGNGDYDGDGFDDLLVQDAEGGATELWFLEDGEVVAREAVHSELAPLASAPWSVAVVER